MSKILTIVIPTYNMERYLHRCLDSLVVDDNTLLDMLEVLVVNDGSKDSSSTIAHEYESKYPNIFRVIDKENGNYGSCVNRGLKEASGRYIKILDADDCFNKKSFEKFLGELKNTDADLIINNCILVSLEGKKLSEFSFKIPQVQNDSLIIPVTIQMHCVAYKTRNLRKINYSQTEGISYTDQEWIFIPMITVKSILYIQIPLYRYTIGRAGQTMDPRVYLNSFGNELIIVKRMFLQYYSSDIDYGNAQWYLYNKIKDRIRTIYKNIIIDARCCKDKNLISFDNTLTKDYPDFYNNEVMNIYLGGKLHFRFIRYWKMNGYHISLNHPAIILYRIKEYVKRIIMPLFYFNVKK